MAAPVRAADAEVVVYGPGRSSRQLTKTDGLKLQEVFFEAGQESSSHAHAEEQAAYIVSGSFEITLADDRHTVAAGDAYAIPSGVDHSVRAVEGGSYILVSAQGATHGGNSDGGHGHDHGHHGHDH